MPTHGKLHRLSPGGTGRARSAHPASDAGLSSSDPQWWISRLDAHTAAIEHRPPGNDLGPADLATLELAERIEQEIGVTDPNALFVLVAGALTTTNLLGSGRRGPAALAFGAGPHYCLGAALAQREAEIALPMLLSRFPAMAPAGMPQRHSQMLQRGFTVLPVRLEPAEQPTPGGPSA